MERLNSIKSRSRILPGLQAILKRVGFAVLLLALGSKMHAQPFGVLWSIQFGSQFNDYGLSLEVESENEIIIGGSYATSLNLTDFRPIIVSLNSGGEACWSRVFEESSLSEARIALQTNNRHYLIAGRQTDLSFGVELVDSAGAIQWEYESHYPAALALDVCGIRLGDSGFLVVHSGGTTSFGDIFVLRLTNSGDTLWTKQYGYRGHDRITSVLQVEDRGFLLFGSRSSANPDTNTLLDTYMLKIDSTGQFLWDRSYGGFGDEWTTSALPLECGYQLNGYRKSVGDPTSYLFSQTVTHVGDCLWARSYPELGNFGCWGSDMESDCLAAVGTCNGSEISVQTISCSGSLGDSWHCDVERELILLRTRVVGQGHYVVVGHSITDSGDTDLFIAGLGTTTSVLHESAPIATSLRAYNYPNPFTGKTTIVLPPQSKGVYRLDVYDVLGRRSSMPFIGNLHYDSHSLPFETSDLPSGQYFAIIKGVDFEYIVPMTVIK